MKAPDKIYVHTGAHLGLLTLTTIPVGGPAEQEFIRKEALLEWAKEVHDPGPIKDSADKGDAWSIGYLCGMRDIIDKLNSI